MVKKKKEVACEHPCCSKGAMTVKAVVAILLGLVLWFGYLELSQVFALVLVLVGLKLLFYHCCKK